MGKYDKEKPSGIKFGRWRLQPCTGKLSANWELYRDGKSTGRYYQADTFGNALRHAADEDVKSGLRESAVGIEEALGRYEAVVSKLMGAFDGWR